MSRAIPCMGYESRSAAIVSLMASGYTETRLSRMLDLPTRTISSLAARHRARMRRKPEAVEIQSNTREDLRREAIARGITIDELTDRLLRTIILDNLFGAILDD